MARLEMSFFGPFSVSLDGQPITGFESSKVRALLAYLAMQPERAHTRSALTALLWPEQAEDSARANLRQALSNLRRAIGDPGAPAPFLLISREAIQFDAAADSWLDVAAFTDLLDTCRRHAHRRAELCAPCAGWLTRAVTLYRGAFLDGLFAQDSVALEEWMLLQQEVLQRRALGALYQLAAFHERRGAYDEAYRFAMRQIQLDPWREEAHRQVMRVLALRGERTAALAQYETCRRLLDQGLGVEPAEETAALYRQIRAAPDETSLTPDQFALPSTRPHNLPPQLTPFIGRERELARLAELIEQQEYRLISLVGQGGSGKTRVALQAAAEQIEAFADGVRYVSLASVPSSGYLVSTIGAALGLAFSGQKTERTQLLDELRTKEMLLVLDNFEHLLDAVDLLATILQQAAGVTLLITTRERLNLQGECVVAVEGLPYPLAETVEPPESFPAVQLFLQSARRVDSRFAPATAEEAAAVVRICQMVGGLPLAIELAAAWTPVLSSAEIHREISGNLDLLATRLRDVPERHRSLRAVFDYSWHRLSPEEGDLLSRLSVFRGGFRREAGEQGAGATLPLLSSLVAKTLLRRTPRGRYEMHELLRQYAESKLGEAADAGREAHDRHCRYYAGFVAGREGQLRGKEQLSAREEIAAEIDNVRAAWHWAVEQKQWAEIAKQVEGRWFYCEIGGLFQEADEAYAGAAGALEAAVDGAGAAGQDALDTRRRAILLGKILARRGAIIGLRLGRIREGRSLLERSLALFRRWNERRETAFALNILGSLARVQCEYKRAKEHLAQSLELFTEVGDHWGRAYSLSDLGNVAYLLGNYGEARRLHEQSLAISRQTGDRRAMLFCLNDSTSVATALGDYAEGRRSSREALALARELGHPWGEATALYQMAAIASDTGADGEAQALLEQSLAAFQELGDRQGAILPLQQLGYLAYVRQEYAQARDLLKEALATCREVSDPRGVAAALNHLGAVAHAVGESREARTLLREALATAVRIEAWPLALDVLVGTARVAVADAGSGEQLLGRRMLAVACQHPATAHHTREAARALLARYPEHDASGIDARLPESEPAISLQQIIEEYALAQDRPPSPK
jgi:DNA-binding SARP family transcriptional activator/predicted ATPase